MTFSFAPKEYRATIPSAGNISFAPAQYQTADTPRANPAPAGVVAVRDRPLVIRIANANRPRRDASADVFHRNLSQAKNLIGLGWQTGVRSLQHLQTALSCERQAFDLLSAILDDDDDGPAGALLIQLCGFALQQLATLGQGDSFDKELADQFLRLALDCAMRVTGKLAANLREQIVTALGKAAGPLPDASPFRRWLVEAQNALVAAMCDHAGRDPESAGFEAQALGRVACDLHKDAPELVQDIMNAAELCALHAIDGVASSQQYMNRRDTIVTMNANYWRAASDIFNGPQRDPSVFVTFAARTILLRPNDNLSRVVWTSLLEREASAKTPENERALLRNQIAVLASVLLNSPADMSLYALPKADWIHERMFPLVPVIQAVLQPRPLAELCASYLDAKEMIGQMLAALEGRFPSGAGSSSSSSSSSGT